MHADDYPWLDVHTDHRSASVVQVESSKLLPLIVLLSVIAGVAVALAWFATVSASHSEREARMLQYYVLEMDAKLIAAGFKTDAESVAKRLKENEP